MILTVEIPTDMVKNAIQDRQEYQPVSVINPGGTSKPYSVIVWPSKETRKQPLYALTDRYWDEEQIKKLSKAKMLELLLTEVDDTNFSTYECRIIHG